MGLPFCGNMRAYVSVYNISVPLVPIKGLAHARDLLKIYYMNKLDETSDFYQGKLNTILGDFKNVVFT